MKDEPPTADRIIENEYTSSQTETVFEDGDYLIAAVHGARNGKRQAGSPQWYTVDGEISNDCTTAPVYRLFNDTLTTMLAGAEAIYSTEPGLKNKLFIPTYTSSSINTTFTMGPQGSITWRHPSFFGGQAQFCAMIGRGIIYAVFARDGFPEGCLLVQLTLFSIASCTDLQRSMQTQINALSRALNSIQLNTYTANVPTTVVQSVVVTNTPPAQTQTATRVVTATTSILQQLPAPSLCGNQGMQYGVFANNQPAHVNQDVYSAYDPTYLKARGSAGSNSTWTTIYYNSTIPSIGGYQNNCGATTVTLYSGAPRTVPCQQFSADYRGYLYVYMAGQWSFVVTGVDDAFVLWLGPVAQRGWTKANANLSLAFSYNTGAPTGTFTTFLDAGTYVPMRVVHGQGVGGYGYQFTIQDPNRAVALTTASQGSGYIVQNSCDRTTAPPFVGAFGEEV
ncbi:hypothetical protein CBER1_00119 [Cercospora berteroae]|uniref:PA14 domain-containing protein n=1 Tax=Cercospora berteroae TaxID=357750 RepID=A0A2S6CDG9_9PEZI|nr:hypothetical protein CBER1_00119 [Cercospora berteroae]